MWQNVVLNVLGDGGGYSIDGRGITACEYWMWNLSFTLISWSLGIQIVHN
jgi:hypothetical protein